MKAKNKKRTLSATSLKNTLIVLNVLIIAVALVGFYFAQDWIRTQAKSSKSGASSSQSETSQLKNELSAQRDNVKKAELLIMPKSTYVQTITSDLQTYAKLSNLSIGNITTTTPPRELTPPQLNASISPQYLLVSLNNPVRFNSFITFLKLLETNSPKIQVVNMNIDSPTDDGENVNIDKLIIEVYVR